MAERRSLHKKISVSEQVSDMSIAAQLFYTWSIPHADDLGLLPNSVKTLRAKIVPMNGHYTDEIVSQCLSECIINGLYVEVVYENYKGYLIRNFYKHQTLKKDRNPQTDLPIEWEKSAQKNWEKVEEIIKKWDNGFHVEDDGFQEEYIGNGREVKRREVKGSEEKDSRRDSAPNTNDEFFESLSFLIGKDTGNHPKATFARDFLSNIVENVVFPENATDDQKKQLTQGYKNFLWREAQKFLAYWNEKDSRGKPLWKTKKTFEYNLRFFRWISDKTPASSAVRYSSGSTKPKRVIAK